jgi:hypothetical protein
MAWSISLTTASPSPLRYVFVVAFSATLVAVPPGCGRARLPNPQTARASVFFTDPKQLRLAEAVERGDAGAIAAAVRDGANVDRAGRYGMRMLLWAMTKGSVAGYRALLDHDANLLARLFVPERMKPHEMTRTLAEITASYPDKAFLHAMLEHGFDPNLIVQPKLRESLLFYVVWKHDLRAAEILLDAGADVNQRGRYEDTAMHTAVDISDYRMANLLWKRGGDPAIRNKGGFDVCAGPKLYGSRGVTPEQEPAFEQFVAEMERRGLMTREDIIAADRPKDDGSPGVTIVEHPAGSPTGRAIKEMDRRQRQSESGRGR